MLLKKCTDSPRSIFITKPSVHFIANVVISAKFFFFSGTKGLAAQLPSRKQCVFATFFGKNEKMKNKRKKGCVIDVLGPNAYREPISYFTRAMNVQFFLRRFRDWYGKKSMPFLLDVYLLRGAAWRVALLRFTRIYELSFYIMEML